MNQVRPMKPMQGVTQALHFELERLNAAEREALLLLAQGHTAKSIASLKNCSIGAVNERLREARRKTGAGSSRELARLLQAQETRDEKIAMAVQSLSSTETDEAKPVGHGIGGRKGLIMMMASLLGATIVTTLLMQEAPSTIPSAMREGKAGVPDPMLEGALPPEMPDPNHLHAAVRAEKRDVRWAPHTEAAVKSYYSSLPHVGEPGVQFRVICGRTLCEVAGIIDAPLPSVKTATPGKELNEAMKSLQGRKINEDMRQLGLSMETMVFTGSKTAPTRQLFLAYWSRVRD